MVWVPFSGCHVGLNLRSFGVWSALFVHVLLQGLHCLSQRIITRFGSLTRGLTQKNWSYDSALRASQPLMHYCLYFLHMWQRAHLKPLRKGVSLLGIELQFDLHLYSSQYLLCNLRAVPQAPAAGGEQLLCISHSTPTTTWRASCKTVGEQAVICPQMVPVFFHSINMPKHL